MKCLIVDDIHEVLISGLKKIGIEVFYEPFINRENALLILFDIDILVVRSKFLIDKEVIDKSPSLKAIARAGAGLDNIDEEYAKIKNIQVFHAATGNSDAVAEHTMAMILCLLAKIASADKSVRNGNWDREKYRGIELKGKTVGILGYGHMGRAVAVRLKSFGCKVIAYDKYLKDWPDENAIRVDFETLCFETEILTLHIPLTEETHGWVDVEFLKKCRRGLFLINMARGKILRLEGLANLLEEGILSGLALDVLEEEPPVKINQEISSKYRSLFEREDVLFTPHVGGWTVESYEGIAVVLEEKIRVFYNLSNW
jgi:D-3-phosphoglycerate dehydrogenase